MTSHPSSSQDFVDWNNSVTIHHKNIRRPATETNKFLQGLSPPILNKAFVE